MRKYLLQIHLFLKNSEGPGIPPCRGEYMNFPEEQLSKSKPRKSDVEMVIERLDPSFEVLGYHTDKP